MLFDFVKTAIEGNTDKETGKVDVTAVMNAVQQEGSKYVIPKEQYDKQSEQLKDAQDTMKGLQSANADNKDLQKQIEDWKGKFESSQKEYALERGKQSIKDELSKLGATDPDYLLYKWGEVKMNQDGTISNKDNKIKELQENFKDYFKQEPKEPAAPAQPNGFKVFDNKLPEGQVVDPNNAVDTVFAKALGLKNE